MAITNHVKLFFPIALLIIGWPLALLAQEGPIPNAIPLAEPTPAQEPSVQPPALPEPAQPTPVETPPPPGQPAPYAAAASPPATATAASTLAPPPATDVDRTRTQWFALNSYSGVMTTGHPLAGGALRLFRLRQTYTYVTLISLRAVRTTLSHGTAGFIGAFMQGGLKLTAGRHVFYLGAEAGYGISGYTIRSTSSKQQVGIYLSPHIEYNCHFSDGVALVVELKVLPPLGQIEKSATDEPSLWSFGGGLGLAF